MKAEMLQIFRLCISFDLSWFFPEDQSDDFEALAKENAQRCWSGKTVGLSLEVSPKSAFT